MAGKFLVAGGGGVDGIREMCGASRQRGDATYSPLLELPEIRTQAMKGGCVVSSMEESGSPAELSCGQGS